MGLTSRRQVNPSKRSKDRVTQARDINLCEIYVYILPPMCSGDWLTINDREPQLLGQRAIDTALQRAGIHKRRVGRQTRRGHIRNVWVEKRVKPDVYVDGRAVFDEQIGRLRPSGNSLKTALYLWH